MKGVFPIFVLSYLYLSCSSHKTEEVSEDALCAGCEATAKALSMHLSFNSKEVLEKEIPKVLRTICDEENYKETEFNPSKVRSACKQLLKKRKTDITNALINYYSKKRQSQSYLDLSEKLCGDDVTGVCVKPTEHGRPTEGKVIFNDETQEFEVIMGDNVRMPRPLDPEKLQKPSIQPSEAVHVKPLKPTVAQHDSHDEL